MKLLFGVCSANFTNLPGKLKEREIRWRTFVWLNKINDKGKLVYYIARHFKA